MPLDSNNYINFFQGACAESHIAAQLQFAGFEVNKVSPDAGIDFVVTNVARSKFKQESSKSIQVQVKSSTVSGDQKVRFLIDNDELKFLCEGEDRYTVFAIFKDLQSIKDEDPFDIYADMIDRMIQEDIEKYKAANANGQKIKKNIFDFTKYSLTLFWLNSEQLQRSRSEGLWKSYQNSNKSVMEVNIDNDLISIENFDLLPALLDVRYMMLPAECHKHLTDGKFSYQHI